MTLTFTTTSYLYSVRIKLVTNISCGFNIVSKITSLERSGNCLVLTVFPHSASILVIILQSFINFFSASWGDNYKQYTLTISSKRSTSPSFSLKHRDSEFLNFLSQNGLFPKNFGSMKDGEVTDFVHTFRDLYILPNTYI